MYGNKTLEEVTMNLRSGPLQLAATSLILVSPFTKFALTLEPVARGVEEFVQKVGSSTCILCKKIDHVAIACNDSCALACCESNGMQGYCSGLNKSVFGSLSGMQTAAALAGNAIDASLLCPHMGHSSYAAAQILPAWQRCTVCCHSYKQLRTYMVGVSLVCLFCVLLTCC